MPIRLNGLMVGMMFNGLSSIDHLCVATLQNSEKDLVERVPFLLLGIDLPPTPLFKDVLEKVVIPQVSY